MSKLHLYPHHTTGCLVTFCGLDGCGKTTLIQRLVKDHEEENLFLTRQPTSAVRNSPIFRTYMDEPDHSAYDYRSLSLLAASDRLQHTKKVILPMLRQGKLVISDRYFYSCLANLRARGFAQDRWIYEISKHVPRPDLAVFLDVPVEVAVARVRNRPEEKDRYIDMELQYRLRLEYQKICRKNGGILISTQTTEPEEAYELIKKELRKVWKQK